MSEKKTITKAGEVTAEVLKVWKAEFGKVHQVTVEPASRKFDPYVVPDDDGDAITDGLVGYLRPPTDKEASYALGKFPNIIAAGKIVLKTCWLGGDEAILTDERNFTAGGLRCVELLENRRSQLKEV
jgi:hypothetical protein